MKTHPYRAFAAGTAALTAVLIAGCGGGNKATVSSTPATPRTTPPASASGASVDIRQTGLGKTLVDGAGRTLYLFEKDSGTRSVCYGACAGVWQPFTTSSRPTVGSGAEAAKIGTTRRRDGAMQVTYGGHPVYFYALDTKPGDVKGEGLKQFGAEWYALSPSGAKLEKKGEGGAKGSSGGSKPAGSSGGSGYSY